MPERACSSRGRRHAPASPGHNMCPRWQVQVIHISSKPSAHSRTDGLEPDGSVTDGSAAALYPLLSFLIISSQHRTLSTSASSASTTAAPLCAPAAASSAATWASRPSAGAWAQTAHGLQDAARASAVLAHSSALQAAAPMLCPPLHQLACCQHTRQIDQGWRVTCGLHFNVTRLHFCDPVHKRHACPDLIQYSPSRAR